MGENDVVAVVVALGPHLPIGIDTLSEPAAVELQPAGGRHACRTIKQAAAPGTEVFAQRPGGAALVCEHEPPVDADLAGLVEANIGFLVDESLRERRSQQCPVEVVGPSVIGAAEVAAVSLGLGAQRGSPVRAPIRDHADLAFVGTSHEHLLGTEPSGYPVAAVGYLGFVAHEYPAVGEYVLHLVGEDGRVGVQASVHSVVLHQVRVVPAGANDRRLGG